MNAFNSSIPIHVLGLALFISCGSVLGQQNIANPLIRPAVSQGLSAQDQGAPSGERPVAAPSAQSDEDLRRQAERRVTQEDLNIRQQALNTPVVPAQLASYFSNMQVTALLRGAVVLRRVEQRQSVVTVQPVATNAAQGAATPATETRTASKSTAVLRLKAGQTTNVNGYPLRATVNGLDVSVDWLSESGRWVNVYYGTLESSHEPNSQTPDDSRLIKVDTDAYDYLVPALTTRTFSAGGNLGGQGNAPGGGLGGGFGGGFGGGAGGFGGGQGGFGTGFPN